MRRERLEELPAGDARRYHEATKHSWLSVRRGNHVLDWDIKPFPFKVYPDAPAVPLPREIPPAELSTAEALARVTADPGREGLDLPTLAQVLFFSAGLTRKKVYPGGETVYFRAAPSTGALYEIEVYVVAGAVEGLDPALYHFCPGDFALRRLRAGDLRGRLAADASLPVRVEGAPATLVLTALYWRNTWKYQARAYRHFFWDAGTLLANLLAVATAADLPACILLGFADAGVNHLLGLDVEREGAVALVPLGRGAPPPPPAGAVPPLELATVPLSPREVDYPLVRAAYLASSLESGEASRTWARGAAGSGAGPESPAGEAGQPRERGPDPAETAGTAGARPLAPLDPPLTSLGHTILRRGSTREFAREPIGFPALSAVLDLAVRPLPLDAGDPPYPVETYLLVHAVEGLEPGAYVYEPAPRLLRLLRRGRYREEGAYLCLEQALGGDASAVAFFLADLGALLAARGNRGYRLANLVAGLWGGRVYLAAYALGLGATGLTFYDDEVVRFFAPRAAGRDALFVTALGRPARARGSGPRVLEGRLHRLAPGQL